MSTPTVTERAAAFAAARARQLEGGAGARRSGVEHVFAGEIAARPPGERPLLRAALESAAGEAAWRRRRAERGLDARAAEQALAAELVKLLERT